VLGRVTLQRVQQVLHLLHVQQEQFKEKSKQEHVHVQVDQMSIPVCQIAVAQAHLTLVLPIAVAQAHLTLVLPIAVAQAHLTLVFQTVVVRLLHSVVTVQVVTVLHSLVTVQLHQYVQGEALVLLELGQVMTFQPQGRLLGHVDVHDVDKPVFKGSV
jgi:hypothetical protein